MNKIEDHNFSRYEKGLRLSVLFILAAFSIILARILFLQIIKGGELLEKSTDNAIRERTIIAVRGSVIDCQGEVLTKNQASYNIVFLSDDKADVNKLWTIFREIYAPNPPPFPIDALIPKKGRAFETVCLERNVPYARLAAIEARTYDLLGVSVELVPTRVYERGAAMAHLIGYTGEISASEMRDDVAGNYKMGSIVGKGGVEKTADLWLRGEDGAEQIEINVKGKEQRVVGRIAPVAGHNVFLNVDGRVQEAVYSAMGKQKGAVVMLNVNNGAVIALVSTPAFDPNIFSGTLSATEWSKIVSSPDHPLENRAVSGLYPPGSTYKPFIAITALEEGAVDKESSVYCRGGVDIGSNFFRCWRKEGHGRISLQRAIVESCDVYFYNIGKSLDVNVIAKYAKAFWFGFVTGIDLDREKRGTVPTKDWKMSQRHQQWRLCDTISVVIGQGYNLVTPLQLAVAYAAIANGGVLWRPQVVRRVESVDGKLIKEFTPEKIGEISISPENLSLVRKGLEGVVNEMGGTGALARIPGILVCGKTGTAQVVSMSRDDAGKKKRSSKAVQDHALFVAYAPCNNPEVAIAVVIENAGHGGAAAAPIARAGIESYFRQKREKASAISGKVPSPSASD